MARQPASTHALLTRGRAAAVAGQRVDAGRGSDTGGGLHDGQQRAEGRNGKPSAGVLDSQTIKTSANVHP
ncbi:hypothetical protein [Streptomyces sp. NPDC090798]|uniref:hypothetical protein n=1 Tax=Streptomyces sp. NPDC090798 TaxID=3365968 RepID=UPI0038066D2A